MLKLGDKSISKLYYGDRPILKAYLGDKLVYNLQPIFLDYVIFDGDSYIDTGLKHESCRIETAVKYESGQSRRMLTGWSGAGSYWGMQSNGKLEVSGSGTTDTDLTDYTTLEIVLDNENLLFTVTADNITKTVAAVYVNSTYTIGCTTPSSANKIIGNIYYHRAYNTDGVLIQDLRPCIHPTTKQVGFYDMVTKKYFYNQGTGTLTAGGRFVQSILFDGASYINTGIAHQTCTIETTIRFEETGTRQLMGFGSSSGQYWGKGANQTTFEYFSGTNAMDKTDVVLEHICDDPTAPYIIMHADGKSRAGSTGTKISVFPYIIGCLKNSLTSTTMYYSFTGEVWRNTTIIGGEIIQDLRPYVDSDGVACFKDVVTNNLFYNQGTGTLTFTE